MNPFFFFFLDRGGGGTKVENSFPMEFSITVTFELGGFRRFGRYSFSFLIYLFIYLFIYFILLFFF